ncbi:uncharacterized protein LOC128189881 [Crassostrea angulata]|uniref:uncharacterized protein LOC128189881 n=1 Tax=Magallana angulata TaxID=2784310 RepID=UPI0022B0DDFE|nr:uncharacterized protein LOC128189881 [Crassostrea angulata]
MPMMKVTVIWSLEKEGKRKFVDDCGSWRGISMKTIEYLANQGFLETLYKKKGIYCRSVKRTQVPLDPKSETLGLGEWQGSAPHGNAKRTTQPYKRTTLNNNQ